MLIYISGKVTGDPVYRAKFLKAEQALHRAGYRTVNPTRLVSEQAGWYAAMRICIMLMVGCRGVALLPDWQESKGASLEERLARDLGIPVKPLDEWLKEEKQ